MRNSDSSRSERPEARSPHFLLNRRLRQVILAFVPRNSTGLRAALFRPVSRLPRGDNTPPSRGRRTGTVLVHSSQGGNHDTKPNLGLKLSLAGFAGLALTVLRGLSRRRGLSRWSGRSTGRG